MITEIITSIFNSILKQEEIYLNNNIEQLSEFRKRHYPKMKTN
ncbi:hypothetical protein ACO2E7_05845 [Staphylococcus epidermidis]